MFNLEMFTSRKDKLITIVYGGANGTAFGKIVNCTDKYLVLSTRWSSNQYINLSQISSFWCDEDKPTEE